MICLSAGRMELDKGTAARPALFMSVSVVMVAVSSLEGEEVVIS